MILIKIWFESNEAGCCYCACKLTKDVKMSLINFILYTCAHLLIHASMGAVKEIRHCNTIKGMQPYLF